MKIISWNVNGIRSVINKWFREFLKKYDPDIFCLQETKASKEQFLKEIWYIPDYNYIWHIWKKKWYAWTAIFYKEKLNVLNTKNHFWQIEYFNEDWRITEIELKDFVLINWYFPNGWTKADWTEMLSYKLEFYDKLIDYCNKLVAGWQDVIITWDFNIANTEIDIARPKENESSIWFLPIERAKITEFLNNGYIDVFRHFYKDVKNIYSWWTYRAWARQKNVGWRIDYFFVNKNFIDKVEDIKYLTDVLGSDHCPVMLKLK